MGCWLRKHKISIADASLVCLIIFSCSKKYSCGGRCVQCRTSVLTAELKIEYIVLRLSAIKSRTKRVFVNFSFLFVLVLKANSGKCMVNGIKRITNILKCYFYFRIFRANTTTDSWIFNCIANNYGAVPVIFLKKASELFAN